jgi:hypothetical protein
MTNNRDRLLQIVEASTKVEYLITQFDSTEYALLHYPLQALFNVTQHFLNNAHHVLKSGEPCADSLPASPELLTLCVSVSENKAGQGVN